MLKIFRKKVSDNTKRLLGASLVLSLAFATSVGAAATSEKIQSRGNIEYDSNEDGEPDVLFYSSDLASISSGLNSLDAQVSVLNSNYDELISQTLSYKSQIIKGLNSNIYAKSNVSEDASFTELIDCINNIPAPTTAVGKYYTAGDNSGLGVGIEPSNPTADVDVDGITTINIGVNESITLPSGYYPNDITIQNNVVNRGSFTTLLTSEQNAVNLPAGYYNGLSISTDLTKINGKITYTLGHHHTGSASSGGGCYTRAVAHYGQKQEIVGYGHYVYVGPADDNWDGYKYDPNAPEYRWVSYTYYTYDVGCGMNEGQYVRETTDINTKTDNEIITKATIEY